MSLDRSANEFMSLDRSANEVMSLDRNEALKQRSSMRESGHSSSLRPLHFHQRRLTPHVQEHAKAHGNVHGGLSG